MTLPLGSILAYVGSALPDGWAFAHGQILAITDHPDLFAAIGSRFGGDGISDFAPPDLRGRQFLGAGQGPDMAAFTPADSGGAEALVLTADQLPAHDHDITLRDIGLQLPAAGAQATLTTPAGGGVPVPLGAPWLAAMAIIRATL